MAQIGKNENLFLFFIERIGKRKLCLIPKEKTISTHNVRTRRHRSELPKVAANKNNSQASRKFRPEVQGLRALAVLLVAAYHFWFGKVSGGVDVFLLISAFLMAGSFTRRIESRTFEGVRAVIKYWVHTFKRILPLATVTVVGVLAGSYLILPEGRWTGLISEAISVVFYYENWWSIHNLVDYYASDSSAASPLRHFWSLSLQGQIYIMWPLVFLISSWIVRCLRLHTRATLLLVFSLIFGFSLAYSIHITQVSQQTAYFNTFARIWEFALGTLVAIILPWLNINRYIRAVLGWIGIAMLISCGFIFDVEGVFPGYHALWPTLAASFIIVAGDTETKFGPEKLLTLKPLLAVGNYSYALYLLHWPLLVFYLYRNNSEKAGIVSGIGLLSISLVLAFILTKCVENPLRSWKKLDLSIWKSLGVVLTCMVLVLGTAYGWKTKINYDLAEAQRLAPYNNPGARSLEEGFVYRGAEKVQKLPSTNRNNDWADMGALCVDTDTDFAYADTLYDLCHHPVKNDNPSKKVIAVGASHIQMWAPALINIAQEQNWDLYILRRGTCYFGYPGDNSHDESCDEYAQDAYSYVVSSNPDLVVVNSTLSAPDTQDYVQPGMDSRVGDLTRQGIKVVGIRDTPRFAQSHIDCEDETREECTLDPGQNVLESPSALLEDKYPGYGDVNMSDIVCPDGCPASIGNVYTYFDYHHISATYAETATGFLSERLLAALNRAEQSALPIEEAPFAKPEDPSIVQEEPLEEENTMLEEDDLSLDGAVSVKISAKGKG